MLYYIWGWCLGEVMVSRWIKIFSGFNYLLLIFNIIKMCKQKFDIAIYDDSFRSPDGYYESVEFLSEVCKECLDKYLTLADLGICNIAWKKHHWYVDEPVRINPNFMRVK